MKRRVFLKMLVIGIIFVSMQISASVINTAFAAETEENKTTNTTTTTTTEEPKVEIKAIKDLKMTVDLSIHSYTGKNREPRVRLYDGKIQLKEGTDFTVTYKNNKNPGKAKITVKGIGNYKGTVKKYFYIAPKKAKIKSVKIDDSGSKITIKWRKDDKASGYKVYMAEKKNGKYKRIKTITSKKTTEYTKKGLDIKKDYYFKVRAYKNIDGEKVCKKYSEPKTAHKLLSKISLTAKGSGSNRNYNLKKASGIISGKVLKPGQSFNWFKDMGPASAARGFKQASVFSNGKVVKGYGGGVCQVSTTLYQAAKKAGLKIVERHKHSKPVTYTKWGKDATVSYGVQNLIIKNNKDYTIKIIASADGATTTCKLYKID